MQNFVRTLFVGDGAADASLIRRFEDRFPGLRVTADTDPSHESRRSRRSGVRLVRHTGSFVKPFPNHPWYGMSGCDFSLVLGYNCFCSCAYCFIQTIFKDRTPTIYANTSNMITELAAFLDANPEAWISTGEYLDSFQLDDVTRTNDSLFDVFDCHPQTTLELRTKIDNVEHLPADPPGNILVTWSINPAEVIDRLEPGTAHLEKRLELAGALRERGYRVALRLDPIIPTGEFAGAYRQLPATIERRLGWSEIDRVFMGILRFDNALLERMSRLPNAALLLDAEFVLCPDGNYRPHSLARRETYRTIAAMIRHFDPNVPISLTMEPDYIRRSLIDPA